MKAIDGFKGYLISAGGVLVSYKRKTPRQLATFLNRYGYLFTPLIDDSGVRKNKTIHRLVAELYLAPPKCDNQTQVNHIDGVKTNNEVSNLEWVTHAENSLHADELMLVTPRLRRKQVKAYTLDGIFIDSYISTQEASRCTGIPQTKVSQCCRGVYKEYNGVVFRFLEDSYYKFPVTPTKYHKPRL